MQSRIAKLTRKMREAERREAAAIEYAAAIEKKRKLDQERFNKVDSDYTAKFEESVKPGGVLIYDPNGITQHPRRTDIEIYQIEGNRLSSELGNKKVFNMIVLGGFLQIRPIVKLENVIEGLKKSLPERYHNLIPINKEAITIGMRNIVPYKVENAFVS